MNASFVVELRKRRVVAILRGLGPREAEAVAEVLLDAGFDWLEVPLNRPGALEALACLSRSPLAAQLRLGAGTVCTTEQVQQAVEAGARYLLSPNLNLGVLAEARRLGVPFVPGVMTPSECFAALEAGAAALKLFPFRALGAAGVRDLQAVLPGPFLGVGGVSTENLREVLGVCEAAGLGSLFWAPGTPLEVLRTRAAEISAIAAQAAPP